LELKCNSCDGNIWNVTIFEIKILGQNVIYSTIKCDGCGMVYPLAQLGKNQSRGSVMEMLRG